MRKDESTSLSVDFELRPNTVAHAVAKTLAGAGIRRIYGLVGGHVKPVLDESSRAGISFVDARHEAAAVHMAKAEADLRDSLGVAVVTAGPGLTNAVTGIADAYMSRSPLLIISGSPPRPQSGLGALEELPQEDLVRPITRWSRTARHAYHVGRLLHAAIRAALGDDGPQGPAYIDIPADLLREMVSANDVWPMAAPLVRTPMRPSEGAISNAVEVIRNARRLLVISGRGCLNAQEQLRQFLSISKGAYLETAESRGLLSRDHQAYLPTQRSRLLAEADVVVTAGRRLDYSLGYGSRAVFRSNPAFVRLGRTREELSENQPGVAQIQGDVDSGLLALTRAGAIPQKPDEEWLSSLRTANAEKSTKFNESISEHPVCDDGLIHPLTLLRAIAEVVNTDAILIGDGGDILSFARIALPPCRYLDPGPLGCLGVGIPFAVSASLNFPNRTVIAIVGDGSAGFNIMELHTAVRHGARPVVVIANNNGWNIERHDQIRNYEGNTIGTELGDCRYDLLAGALGIYAKRVENVEELKTALNNALCRAPSVLDVRVAADVMSPDFRSGLAEVPDFHALRSWNDAEVELRK